jgi:hypothetical protein
VNPRSVPRKTTTTRFDIAPVIALVAALVAGCGPVVGGCHDGTCRVTSPHAARLVPNRHLEELRR